MAYYYNFQLKQRHDTAMMWYEIMSKPQKTQGMSCEWLCKLFFVIEQRLKMSKCGFKKLQHRQQYQ